MASPFFGSGRQPAAAGVGLSGKTVAVACHLVVNLPKRRGSMPTVTQRVVGWSGRPRTCWPVGNDQVIDDRSTGLR